MTTTKTKPTLSKNDDTKTFFSQYKLYVEMLEASTKRRMDTNALFISIHTAMVTVVSLFNKGNGWLVVVGIVGIAFSWVWRSLLINYNNSNALKWDVVYDMEQFLPYKPFYAEYYDKRLKHDTEVWREGNYRSSEKRPYQAVSRLEQNLPVVFIVIYIGIAAYGGYCLYRTIRYGANTTDLAEAVAKVQEAVSKLEATLADVTRSSFAK
ncbi:MAG: hypothetical protein IJR48_06410 [Oscillibacter sp.]|nr:hypothetical protein [Oscillibacter sp.]MBQ9617983.1 hypothetical protein [Oscillibacter sp.]